jgi:thiol-disulfide isomerase/thioredoxin
MDPIGIATIVTVLVISLALGLWRRWSDGRLRDVDPADEPPAYRRRAPTARATTAAAASMNAAAVAAAGSSEATVAARRATMHIVPDLDPAEPVTIPAARKPSDPLPDSSSGPRPDVIEEPGVLEQPTGDRVEATLLADLGLGPAPATLLQFSSAFCAPCRAVRRVSSEVAAMLPDVQHVEVDAESHLEAVRALGIWRTPTLLILDADGRITKRATGVPAKPQLIAALAEVLK